MEEVKTTRRGRKVGACSPRTMRVLFEPDAFRPRLAVLTSSSCARDSPFLALPLFMRGSGVAETSDPARGTEGAGRSGRWAVFLGRRPRRGPSPACRGPMTFSALSPAVGAAGGRVRAHVRQPAGGFPHTCDSRAGYPSHMCGNGLKCISLIWGFTESRPFSPHSCDGAASPRRTSERTPEGGPRDLRLCAGRMREARIRATAACRGCRRPPGTSSRTVRPVRLRAAPTSCGTSPREPGGSLSPKRRDDAIFLLKLGDSGCRFLEVRKTMGSYLRKRGCGVARVAK